MTNPLGFNESTDGPGSVAGQEEWNTFLKMRNESMDSMLARMGIVAGADDVLTKMEDQLLPNRLGWLQPQQAAANAELIQNVNPLDYVPQGLQDRAAQGMPAVQNPQATHQDLGSMEHQNLVDRAKVWNIQGAEQMPTEMLQAALAARRDDAVRPTDIGMMGWLSSAGKLLGSSLALGVGEPIQNFAEKIGSAIQDVPYMAETMASLIGSQNAGMWVDKMKRVDSAVTGALGGVRQFNEQQMAALPYAYTQEKYSELLGYTPTDVLNKIGYGIGYAAPAIASWEAVGALKGVGLLGTYASQMTPIARVAVGLVENAAQGGVANWLMRGGDVTPRETFGVAAGSAALGLVGEMMPGLNQLWSKVTGRFGTPITDFVPNETAQGIGEADWHFSPEQHYLGEAPKLLSPGEPSPVRMDVSGPAMQPDGGDLRPRGADAGVTPPDGFRDVGGGNAAQGDGLLPDVIRDNSGPSPVRALTGGPVGGYDDFVSQNQPSAPSGTQRKFLSGTAVADDNGPIPVYHGTDVGFEQHDLSYGDPQAQMGTGIYYTENPEIAGGNLAQIENNFRFPRTTQEFGYAGQLSYSDLTGHTVPNGAPQVRKSYLDIKNPFRLDADISQGDAHAFVDRFVDINPNVDRTLAHEAMDRYSPLQHTDGTTSSMKYEDIHNALQTLGTGNLQGPFPPASLSQFWTGGEDRLSYGSQIPMGADGVNESLQKMGYDGLTHIGGGNTNNDPHRVWIAWNPTQVHPMYAPYLAADHGITLTKQMEMMQSPLAPELAAQASLGNADVAKAMVASRTGGINIVADIGDLGQTVHDLANTSLQYRFAHHPSGRIDLLASDAPIPDAAVNEYQTHGLMTGQSVTTATGKAGKITQFKGGKVFVKSPYAQRAYGYKASDIYPKSAADAYVEAPEAYAAFRDFASVYTAQESAKAGLAAPGALDPQFTTMLNGIMHNWFAHMGYDGPTAAGLEQYFNVRRMEDFKAVAPAEIAHAEDIQEQADEAEQIGLETHPPDIQRRAEANGFSWVSSPMTAGGQLWDNNSSLKFWMDNEEEADKFMKNFSREMPDHTPGGDVPIEATPHIAQGSMLDPSGTVADIMSALDNPRGAPHVWDSIAEDANDAADETRRADMRRSNFGGGSGKPPAPPAFSEPPGFSGDPRNRLNASRKMDVTYAFADVKSSDLFDMMEKHDGLLSRAILPTRTEMQRWSDHLYNMGVAQKGVDPWSYYEETEAGMKQMESFVKPHWIEVNSILSHVRTKFLVDGTFTKVHEIQDYNERILARDRAGFSPAEHVASEDFRTWTDKLYTEGERLGIWSGGTGFIPQYMSHVRMRSGMPGVVDPWKDTNGDLPEGFEFFADNMRHGGIAIRQMDPRWLAMHYLRAMGWKAYVDQPMSAFTSLANAKGMPTELSQYMLNWAKVAQRGYDLSQDLAIKGLKGMINTVVPGVHLTDQQTAHLLNKGLTSMHWAMLGFQPHVLFRDAIQPLLAGMKGSYTDLAAVYKDIFTSSAMRDEMRQRAQDGGWAEVGRAPVEMPGMFDNQPMNPQGEPLLQQKEAYVHQMLGAIGGWVRDMTPAPLRNVAGTKADPLYLYQKEGSLNRIIAGEVGYRLAARAGNRMRAIAMIQAGLGTSYDKALVKDMIDRNGMVSDYSKGRFLAETHLDGFRMSVGEKAWSLASQGNWTEAAYLAGREMANETQFSYGIRNLAPAMQSPTGRIGMQFGTFSTNFGAAMHTGLTRGSVGTRLKFIAGLLAITAGLKKMSDLTGFNFNNYMWVKAFGWMGGPLVQGFAQQLPKWGAVVNASTGGTDKQAVQGGKIVGGVTQLPRVAAGLAVKYLNPVAGAMKEGNALNNAFNQPNPFYEAAGVLLTGPTAPGATFRNTEQQMEENAHNWLPMNPYLPPTPGAGAQQ